MKAILVIDMPKSCKECCFCGMGGVNLEQYVCCLTGEHGESQHLVGCPLRPLPEPKDIGYPNEDYDVGFADGWDACLKEIEK